MNIFNNYIHIIPSLLLFILPAAGMQRSPSRALDYYRQRPLVAAVKNNQTAPALQKAAAGRTLEHATHSSRTDDGHNSQRPNFHQPQEALRMPLPSIATPTERDQKPGKSYLPEFSAAALLGATGLGLAYLNNDDEDSIAQLENEEKQINDIIYALENNDPNIDTMIIALAKDEANCQLAQKILIQASQKAIDEITTIIGLHIEEFVNQKYSEAAITMLLHHYPSGHESIHQLAQQIAINFNTILNSPKALPIIKQLAAHSKKAFELIICYKNNFLLFIQNKEGLLFFKEFAPKISKSILKLLFTKNLTNNLTASERFTILSCFLHSIKSEKLKKELLELLSVPTATEAHLKLLTLSPRVQHADTIYEYFSDEELFHIAKTASEKQEELDKQGYYTFFHGQKRHFYFPIKLHSYICNAYKQNSIDFIRAHIKQYPPEVSQKEKEQKIYSEIFNADSYDPKEHYGHLLFMNYALFANDKHPGSNSALYVKKNDNARGTKSFAPKDIFEQHNLLSVYKKFKNEIDGLFDDYFTLSKKGTLLLVAVPKKDVNKYVYAITFTTDDAWGGSKQLDAASILQAITDKAPLISHNKYGSWEASKDRIEFCLVMTHKNGGLDPKSGIKVLPLITGKPDRLNELQQRENDLFEKMRPDIEKVMKQKREEHKKNKKEYAAKLQQEIRDKKEHKFNRGVWTWVFGSAALWAAAQKLS